MKAPLNIPFFQDYDAATQRLNLRGASHIPDAVFDFAKDYKVRILDASGGTLTDLPARFAELRDLEILFLSDNSFETIPAVLMQCPKLYMLAFKNCRLKTVSDLPTSLRWLVLTNNQISALPDTFGNLARLEKCALAGNAISSVPDSMADCKNLQLLRLSANAFCNKPPSWLFDLPKLAWYSDAGNPFSAVSTTHYQTIAWDSLVMGSKIGESPSSEVFRATSGSDDVAVKLFRGGLTSDGYPLDDLRASLAAGSHENLIGLRGKLDGRDGIVMDLIDPSYQRLGLPPSFNTVARDSYPDGTKFTMPFIKRTLKGIAQASAHIHARKIMHGDIYAHNILVNAQGRALLGDFGAASFYDDSVHEKIDVRGFGNLMDDLLTRCDAVDQNLNALRDDCWQKPNRRPVFADLVASL